MNKGLLHKVLAILLICYSAIIIANIAIDKDYKQWDLYRYYTCAKAYEAGVNPYDKDAVSQWANKPVFYFRNPPVVLFICSILAKVDYNFIFYSYLILKCLLLVGLIYLWRNAFFDKQVDIMFYLLCLFGFNAAIHLDLRAGNITVFEQCMLWLAFFYYVKHKYMHFCALIIVASLFKMTPIFFLFLLLFTQGRRKYRFLSVSLAVFSAIFVVQYIYNPQLFRHFIDVLLAYGGYESGIINPSSLELLGDLVDFFFKIKDGHVRNIVATLAYVIFIIPIVYISIVAFMRVKAANIKNKERFVVFFSCVVYSVAAYYFKDYSYMLLIVPAYFIMKNTRIGPQGLLVFIASISAASSVTLPGAFVVAHLFWSYYPLFVAYLVWYLYLRELNRLCSA